jgi:DNA-binding CsgD family transcriptional regulator
LLRLHGAYTDAAEEFDRAIERYAAFGRDPALGLAHYERGETLRLQGHLADAEIAYDEAATFGHPAQPGRALLWLAQGRHDAAAAAMGRIVAERENPVLRSQVLAAAVEVLVAVSDIDGAAPLADELERLGREFDCVALKASGHQAVASVDLARGSSEQALDHAQRAATAWTRLDAPYEVARSRCLVGRALRQLGDEESALAELSAARRSLASLGAITAEREAAVMLDGYEAPGGLSPRELEVLVLVAAGKSNRDIAAELVISQKTVARHVSNIFTKLDVASRTAAAAYAYERRLL